MALVKNLAYTTIIFLPLYVIRCSDFSWCSFPLPITLLEVLIVITFLVWLFWLVVQFREGKENFSSFVNRLKNPLILPLAFLLILATISLVSTPYLRGGLGVWKAYFIEGALLYLVVIDISTRLKNFFWVIESLLLSGLVVSLFSIFVFISLAVESGLDEATNARIAGIYEFANAVPLFLGPLIALSLASIVSQFGSLKDKRLFYIAIFSLPTMVAAVLLSQSKGGIVGIFAIMLVWFGYIVYRSLNSKFKKYFRYALSSLVVFYFIFSIFFYVNIDNFAPEKRSTGSSLVNRYCIWQGTRNLIVKNPLTGSGLNGFNIEYREYKTCLSADYFYPHNILLTFWTEVGFLGMLGFIWVSYVYLKMNTFGGDKFISVGLLSALIYIYIHGLVDVPFFKNDLSVEFWLLLSLVSVRNKLDN